MFCGFLLSSLLLSTCGVNSYSRQWAISYSLYARVILGPLAIEENELTTELQILKNGTVDSARWGSARYLSARPLKREI